MPLWITAYDMFSATMANAASGITTILVGDSLANVVYGLDSTREITLETMLMHLATVVRYAPDTRVVFDFPYGSYTTKEQALETARQAEARGTQDVKLEGYHPEIIAPLIEHGFRVTGHLGLLPQTAESLRVQAKTEPEQAILLSQAQHLESLGIHELVVECIPTHFAQTLQSSLNIPVIGIGAGPHTQGQVLVWDDVMGKTQNTPRFVRPFADMRSVAQDALQQYVDAVQTGEFPSSEESYGG